MLGCAGVGDDSDDDGDVIETIIEQQPSLMQVDPHDIEDAEVGGGPMPLRLRLRCALCTLPPLTSARCPLLPAALRRAVLHRTAPLHFTAGPAGELLHPDRCGAAAAAAGQRAHRRHRGQRRLPAPAVPAAVTSCLHMPPTASPGTPPRPHCPRPCPLTRCKGLGLDPDGQPPQRAGGHRPHGHHHLRRLWLDVCGDGRVWHESVQRRCVCVGGGGVSRGGRPGAEAGRLEVDRQVGGAGGRRRCWGWCCTTPPPPSFPPLHRLLQAGSRASLCLRGSSPPRSGGGRWWVSRPLHCVVYV